MLIRQLKQKGLKKIYKQPVTVLGQPTTITSQNFKESDMFH